MISGSSIATLVVFIISIFFVILPISLPLPFSRRLRIPINLTTAPILAIAILWASQCIGVTQIRDGIVGTEGVKPYNILILFFSLAYMAITLDITGVLQAAAFWISNKAGSNARKLFLYTYAMLALLSVVLGNDRVILSGTAFLVYYTKATDLNPLPWLIAEFAAANTASMVLFVGNPANVLICESLNVNSTTFTAYTILPFLACITACYFALKFQFRHPGHLARRVPAIMQLDVSGMLRDPVGAWVGSILLVTCLVVITTVSFFNVDVWMISLPTAVAKWVFDLAWDFYRYKPHQPAPKDEDEYSRDDPMETELKRAMTSPNLVDQAGDEQPMASGVSHDEPWHAHQRKILQHFTARFPTFSTAFPRLPFALIPFAFSQFILIEALAHQGWIDVFADWLVKASKNRIYPTVWIIGLWGVVLCNLAGTNIGATILLTKVVRAAPDFPARSTRAAAIALAVASNIGAVNFTFSASLAGLLWRAMLEQKGIHIKQTTFAFWNLLPLVVMTCVGLAVVSLEMAVLYCCGS